MVADIGLIARTAESSGADALTVANTYPAMAIDPWTGKSCLGNQTGGLSGPSIKPMTLRLVWETYKAIKTPILGVGGIETVEDVLQYVAAGATAVQVGTASFTDPAVSQRLVEGLERALFGAKTFTFNEIRGKIFTDFG